MLDKDKFNQFYEENRSPIRLAMYFGIGLFVLLFLVVVAVLIFGPDRNNNNGDDGRAYLPDDLEKDPNAGVSGEKLNGIKAEDIMFGHFYEKAEDNFRPSAKTYPLPTNVKVEAENYYDVSRKIDLTNHVDELNRKGYKIIDNPYRDADDFFSVYQKLVSDDVPIILTSDFLMYYYQNNLKNVFDEIERNTFYKNVWDIYKSLFDKASARYTERLSRLGISNDPILEGQRLETAYLAIVLKLLSPTPDQVSEQRTLNNHSKFSKIEAINYDFVLPSFLEKDVSAELEQIRKIKRINRSPVMLYAKDYSVFEVPKEYRSDAKLNNFYLATKWLNSEFPLYFRADDCPDCLLDKNDWLINLASASYLAKDLSDNQANKNRWAIIYKFISYFSGLRQDLTYLEYDRALREIYGEGYVIENIFSRKNFTDVEIYKIQAKIADSKFSEIEGCYDRKNGKNPLIGMRMLQEPYWPNDYIFEKLTVPGLLTNTELKARREQLTACGGQRCTGTALDVIGLKVPLERSEKYVRESNYQGYDNAVRGLRDYMSGFNVFTWNTNIYWSTLDTVYVSLNEDRSSYPIYMTGNEWFQEKELNSALGAWTNIHVPKDSYATVVTDQESFSSLRPVCDLPNFIEPKLDMLRENIARNNMLLDMMDVLNVSRDSNLAALDIEEVNAKLEHVLDINKKILSGTLLNYSDCSFIEGLVNNRKVVETGKKSFQIRIGKYTVTESLSGVKLLIAMFTHGEDNIIAIGPVFDYNEVIGR
jgi:hypothetical protein